MCRQDEETKESVAMKKIENAFEHITCLGAQYAEFTPWKWALSRQIFKKNEADLVFVCDAGSFICSVLNLPSQLSQIIAMHSPFPNIQQPQTNPRFT
jgi:hypothetical protein